MALRMLVNSINPALDERLIDFRIKSFNTYELTYEKDGTRQVKTGQFQKDLTDLDLSIQVLRGDGFTEKSANLLKDFFYQFSVHAKETLINRLRGNLKVENPQFTQILKVTLKDVIQIGRASCRERV